MADVVDKYLKKGSKVFVEGKMRTRNYEDRQGIKRSIMEINAEIIELLDIKQQKQQQQEQYPEQANTVTSQTNGENDDLPF